MKSGLSLPSEDERGLLLLDMSNMGSNETGLNKMGLNEMGVNKTDELIMNKMGVNDMDLEGRRRHHYYLSYRVR